MKLGGAGPRACGKFALDDPRSCTAFAFTTLARSRAVLAAAQESLEVSRRMIARSRALCASADGALEHRPRLVRVAAPDPAPRPAAGRPPVAVPCACTGCDAPAELRPWFVFQAHGQRIVVGPPEIGVCAAHRSYLGGEGASRERAQEGRGIRVVFEVVRAASGAGAPAVPGEGRSGGA